MRCVVPAKVLHETKSDVPGSISGFSRMVSSRDDSVCIIILYCLGDVSLRCYKDRGQSRMS